MMFKDYLLVKNKNQDYLIIFKPDHPLYINELYEMYKTKMNELNTRMTYCLIHEKRRHLQDYFGIKREEELFNMYMNKLNLISLPHYKQVLMEVIDSKLCKPEEGSPLIVVIMGPFKFYYNVNTKKAYVNKYN